VAYAVPHIASLPRDAVAYGRQHADLPDARPLDLSAYSQPVPMGPTPRTLREHTGRREFGRVAQTLAGADPTAARLRAVVDRARARGRRHPLRTATPPRLLTLRESAVDTADALFNRIAAAAIVAMVVWIGMPVALTLIAGAL
jgi:hypothetical protein